MYNRAFKKHVEMLSFISRQSNIKISVIKFFPVRGKQKNTLLSNFLRQTCVKNVFEHVQSSKPR